MAYESQVAAFTDETAGRYRAATSRFYYAVYQSVTALLHKAGKQPPGGDTEDGGREAWSHVTTPEMVLNDLNRYIRNRNEREALASKMRFLYKMRVIADYISTERIDKENFASLASDARYVVKLAGQILAEDE